MKWQMKCLWSDLSMQQRIFTWQNKCFQFRSGRQSRVWDSWKKQSWDQLEYPLQHGKQQVSNIFKWRAQRTHQSEVIIWSPDNNPAQNPLSSNDLSSDDVFPDTDQSELFWEHTEDLLNIMVFKAYRNQYINMFYGDMCFFHSNSRTTEVMVTLDVHELQDALLYVPWH